MIIETIATGSKGNAYRISDGRTALLIELGIPFKKLQQALQYKTSDITACLVTHSHQDHCKGIKGALDNGMTVYATSGEIEAIGITHHRLKAIEVGKTTQIGTWKVIAFDVQHDTPEPVGYLIMSEQGEKLLFITDTYYVKQRFPSVDYIMMECNYCESVLDENLESGRIHKSLYKRVMKSHFSLENVIKFLKANDLSKLKEIHLLHLSDSNSNEQMIYEAVARATGKQVIIAQ